MESTLQAWEMLLQLKSEIQRFSGDLSFVYLSDEEILINEYPSNYQEASLFVKLGKTLVLPITIPSFELKKSLEIKLENPGALSEEILQFFQLYLPYCFVSYFAKKIGRSISIAHFAQSLDGKIATDKGDSRWIGNEANLDHAHRMRALCDGIIVGNNTIRNDQPSLTVRRVKGENPRRIVIGSAEVDLSSLMACCADSILVVSNSANYTSSQVEHLRVPSDNCRINNQLLLKLLFEKNIYSVYVEGGAVTTSNFLLDKAVDILQLHISPLIFGSGKQGIVLPKIDEVDECQSFQNFKFYRIGDAMMFVGAL